MFSGEASTYPQPTTPRGIFANSSRISSFVFLFPSFVIVRLGSAFTYLYGMICANPFRICRSRCEPLFGFEFPKTGGASLKENLFQRRIAFTVLPAGRNVRRSSLENGIF